jgi:hypothetical protein
MSDCRYGRIWRHALERLLTHSDPRAYKAAVLLKRVPVTIEEFVNDPDFLGGRIEIWPALMPDLEALNPYVLAGDEPVHEAFLGGATGIGKSTIALVTTLYQVYLLTCFHSPQRLLGLDEDTGLVFPLQSVNPDVTRRVLYEPMRQKFESMPFVQKHLTWNQRRTNTLEIEGGIQIVPLIANIEAVLGQAIPGAVLDEVNYMRIVENSRRIAGPRGLGGRYDQAEEVYRELSQRRKSRFAGQPVSIGCIVVSSSARYQDDFLDRQVREIEENATPNTFVSRHKRYEVVPADRYRSDEFALLVGTDRYRTRILKGDEEAPAGARIEWVPIEHLEEFRRDPAFALRQIIGIAVDTISPFIDVPEKILEAIERGDDLDLCQWAHPADAILDRDGMPRWIEDAIPPNDGALRFAHIDLSRTRDACGIAIVKYLGNARIADPDVPDTVLEKPKFAVELAISIKPSPDCELNFSELRGWLLQIVNRFGIEIHSVSMDGYQSTDTIQIFRKRGIRASEQSVDRTSEPYEYLRECLYEGRLALVDSPTLKRELKQLERNPETGVIDHPPRGSKDVADAVCGAIFTASRSRQIRNKVGYYDDDGVRKRPERQRPSGKNRPQGFKRR